MQIDLGEVVDEYAAAHKHASVNTAVSPAQARATLADVIAKLRAQGITLGSILTVLGPILSMIFAGTSAGPIISTILSLLGGITAPPAGAAGS